MYEHERQFVRVFVAANQKRRFLSLLANARGREKFVRKFLAHNCQLDARYCTRVRSGAGASCVVNSLQELGAPNECFVISVRAEFDGRTMPLDEALESLYACGMGTIISCIPGRLGYYDAEDIGERYICHRLTE